jgi:hypothetical protein
LVFGRFELYDIGTEMSEDLGARRAGPNPGEVAHPDSIERATARVTLLALKRQVSFEPPFAVMDTPISRR